MRASTVALLAGASGAAAASSSTWSLANFRNFLAFGDSYTDENRLQYFAQHDDQAPPPGTFLPESFHSADGGRAWARYVVQYTGETDNGKWEPQLTLYDYAVSGAVCSNQISPRLDASLGADWPDLDGYELPAFLQDRGTQRNGTNATYFEPLRTANNSVYSVWDGTNDVGEGAFFTDSQVPGYTLANYTDCIFNQFDTLYSAGGRFFVLMNLVPLNLAPLYANASDGGTGPTSAWPNKPSNLTAIAEDMAEHVALINEIWLYRIPAEVVVNQRYPGANFALYDVHSLFMDIYTNPSAYFNGSAPANVTGTVNVCQQPAGTPCVKSSSPDSFFWYDILHPSEQTMRHVASEFVNVINGSSKYASYW